MQPPVLATDDTQPVEGDYLDEVAERYRASELCDIVPGEEEDSQLAPLVRDFEKQQSAVSHLSTV